MNFFYTLSCSYPYFDESYKKYKRRHVDIGVFSSLKKAHEIMNKWPKEYMYTINERYLNKDYRKEIKRGMTSENHWHYGVDYYTDFKNKKDMKFLLMWFSKPGSLKYSDRDLDPVKDKKLIRKYRKYCKKIGVKFHKFPKIKL